jgi:hypothetical protein
MALMPPDPRSPPLDYATPPRPVPWTTRRRLAWGAVRQMLWAGGVTLLIGYACSAFAPAVTSVSICTRCGERLRSEEYRLPLTRITLHRSMSREPTLVSMVIAKHGATTGHADRPVLMNRNEQTLLCRSCAVGSNTSLLRVVNDPDVAAFLDNVLSYSDATSGAAWIDRVLTTDFDDEFLRALRTSRFPEGGFATAAPFAAWWGEHQAALLNAAK